MYRCVRSSTHTMLTCARLTLIKHQSNYTTTFNTMVYSTGVYLQPLPDDEIKIMQWMKSNEIKQRKQHMYKLSQRIWAQHNDIDYTRITPQQCQSLLSQYLQHEPTTWQIKQLYHNTLQQYAPYRLDDELQQRRELVDSCVDKIYDEIKLQIKKSTQTIELSKNDMTFKLEDELGELPTSDEVDLIWSERFRLPLVKWIGGD